VTDPSLGQKLTLEDLVPRTGLNEVCRSFTNLFDVPLRILRAGEPPPETAVHPRARYAVAEVRYEGDALGTVVVGPFIPTDSVVGMAPPGPDAPPLPPRIKPATAERLVKHVLAMLDVMLWSGHRAFLASQMQVASAGEAYREITAKNRALADSLKALQEVDRLKSNFMGTISHELRTPLTSILGYAEMLAEGIGGTLTFEQKEFVQIIRGKGEGLLAMISNILELSKLDAETSVHGRSEVDLCALCEDLIGAAEGAAARRKVALGLSVEADLPRIETDLERIRKVVAHLLDNAIKFTTPGGSVHVTLAAETPAPDELSPVGLALLGPANQRVTLTIADTGIGISSEHLPYVFDAFYQVDGSSTREYGGTGLGLAIVRRLTESLGGHVTATSEPGRGSVFRVVLPVAPG
jgi:signal transduction histidine kinase